VKSVTNELATMGVIGNGVTIKALTEAGIKTADLLIAVTGSDEQNLLCCVVARKASECKTIARVRNPIYSTEIPFLRAQLGISAIINPELTSAHEIARIFRFPSAVKIDRFAKGRFELLHFKITPDCKLIDLKLMNLKDRFQCNILVCMVTRGEDVFIPRGDFVLKEGDKISIAATPKEVNKFFKKIGVGSSKVSTAMIVGGGNIAYYLAQRLDEYGLQIKIIESNPARCEELSTLLPEATIICGDGTDQNLLLQEGIENVQGFAALTGMDEENIILSLYAKKMSKAKTVTKINRVNFDFVMSDINLDTITYPRKLTADVILKYARSMNASLNSNVENLYKLEEGKAEALEFYIKEPSAVTDVPISQLNIKKNVLICGISHNGQLILPGGQDKMQVGDSVVVVLTHDKLNDLKEILEG
ncbi:MAG: Trk system potassium transporter TrkA, partial [Lachnospiraceae bacterium]|nr:Trk system potassium transporter TrkA [Lachnospiraceae bacterium]